MKLNYEALDNLDPENDFEVTHVDVKRLRDDRSEIQQGDEIAFVALASFRVTPDGARTLKDTTAIPGIQQVAGGDELFVIGSDAELRSDRLSIDEDSVALWLHDRYDFQFVLDGAASPSFAPMSPVRIATESPDPHPDKLELPWLRRLNTAAIKGDYVDVDVRIDPRRPGAQQRPSAGSRRRLTAAIARAEFQEATIGLTIALDATATTSVLDDLCGRTFRVPLESDAGCAVLELTIGRVQRHADKADKTGGPGHPARPPHKP